ncbi:MAG: pyrroloquinoline quinone biosynthesis protein PqqB [Candidatus Kapaibacterium sp.]
MTIKLLGTAAGGGFPQWNCTCANCARLRNKTLRGSSRTQVQLACELEADHWVLVNASPDLHRQIESARCLWPIQSSNRTLRQSPICGVVLTSAELDGTLGLLLLREFQPLDIYCTPSVRRILTETNSMFRMLQRESPQANWHDILPSKPFVLGNGLNAVRMTPISVRGKFPEYVEKEFMKKLSQDEAVISLLIESVAGSRKLLFSPAVGQIDERLEQSISDSDILLWDGTFWEDDELFVVRGTGKKASEMGHLPISGVEGSLSILSGISQKERFFIHINNTNPILDEESKEYEHVRSAGWEVAKDGMEFVL